VFCLHWIKFVVVGQNCDLFAWRNCNVHFFLSDTWSEIVASYGSCFCVLSWHQALCTYDFDLNPLQETNAVFVDVFYSCWIQCWVVCLWTCIWLVLLCVLILSFCFCFWCSWECGSEISLTWWSDHLSNLLGLYHKYGEILSTEKDNVTLGGSWSQVLCKSVVWL